MKTSYFPNLKNDAWTRHEGVTTAQNGDDYIYVKAEAAPMPVMYEKRILVNDGKKLS